MAGNARSSRQVARFEEVTLKGELAVRYQAATCNLLTRPDRYSIESYVASAKAVPGALWWDWPGDQIGRMLSVLHVAQGYGWMPAAGLREAVADAVLPCQTKDGYFGTDPSDRRLISGNAFALRGLMDAYEDTHETRYLDAARRIGRFATSVLDRFVPADPAKHADEFFHYIDGLVRLYQAGGDTWALDTAKKIAARAGLTEHTHHSLTFYRGVIDLYRLTGDKQALQAVERYLAWCKQSRLVTGGLPEGMPASPQDEGCANADYVVVNLMMFAVTGKDVYVDEAEHILVNHFMMSQFHTGGFGHRVFAQDVLGGKLWQGWDGAYGSENPGCCSLWGQWALGQMGRYLVTQSGKAVEVNLYSPADVALPEAGCRLEIQSDFPRCSHAVITVRCDKSRRFPLHLRVPAWAEGVSVAVNGEDVDLKRGSRAVLDRRWSSGDVVKIHFQSGLRLVKQTVAGPDKVAVFDGPLCLGLSALDGDVDALQFLATDEKGALVLTPTGRPQVLGAAGRPASLLKPVYLNWQDPDVKNPHRMRVLFGLRKPDKAVAR